MDKGMKKILDNLTGIAYKEMRKHEDGNQALQVKIARQNMSWLFLIHACNIFLKKHRDQVQIYHTKYLLFDQKRRKGRPVPFFDDYHISRCFDGRPVKKYPGEKWKRFRHIQVKLCV